ncbi:MAG: hypothetical protein IT584_01435 [Chlamydiae bacterium]|nr:hypothetical protein [Chlamydiota bacterium]
MMLYLRLRSFRKAFFFICLLLLGAFVFIYVSMLREDPKDLASYKKLVKDSLQVRSKRVLEKTDAKEARSNVQKDIWTMKNGKESHAQLCSDSSDLTIYEKNRKFYAKEIFQHLMGFVELDGKETYNIEAKDGFYEAPNLEFFIYDANLYTDRTFFLEASKAHLISLQGPLLLQDNVRFVSLLWQDKQTFALADSATYCPQRRLFILKGLPGKPVLCWQNGATFAASELHILQDTKTVEGVGDIRCSFDREEQKTFSEMFARYL